LQVAQRGLERELATASQAYAVKVAAIRSWAPDSVHKFQEAAALADRHYRLGAVPLGTYVELQSAYLDAMEALLDTRRGALEAGLKLEELSGQKLELQAKP
ncbi:MAG: transporter, partial [Opitutus sp.]